MIKYFCDKCGEEISEQNKCVGGYNSSDRIGVSIDYRHPRGNPFVKKQSLSLELLVRFNGEPNEGHFCKYCIIDAFCSLDDRPKEEKA